MPLTIYLSGHLTGFTGGKASVALDAELNSVGEALDSLFVLHPGLRDRVLNEQGEVRQHVNVFIGSDDVKRKDGLETPLTADTVHIFNAVSGG